MWRLGGGASDVFLAIFPNTANRDIHQYCQGFLWNEAKFPLDVPLPKLEEELSRTLAQTEEKFKQLQQTLSQKKQQQVNLERRAGCVRIHLFRQSANGVWCAGLHSGVVRLVVHFKHWFAIVPTPPSTCCCCRANLQRLPFDARLERFGEPARRG